ncbi:DUF4198 domain-containing protein [Robiginitalea aurantiaca]|uniref:DUF4198 domain-containing protein n=1 Tax=Robiginitalea aurantiaca TaxID=3056915 RepID=A0ABT7WH55_9FLAO|nr:DUF4198 domain-containing protein [Robiginitalea aurantiaca]MDM9632249.1 DUF4198 domain-containing protein [Robiginitalea aurantiaca]
MRKKLLLLGLLVLLSGHDMYLKLDSYFLPPATPVELHLYNGTFNKSENVITTDRMLDVSLAGQGRRVAVETSQWSDRDSITVLNFTTGDAGTWVAGVSTAPRNIEMSAGDFNNYLEHDGVLDMLEWRRENNAMDEPAVEKYSKHVKAIFQVGDKTSEDWATVLGYPIEFVPLENPYDLHPGHTLGVKLLLGGQPLANQLVYVGFEGNGADAQGHTHEEGQDHDHDHDSEADHSHTGGTQVRTNEEGIAQVFLPAKGTWYLRTIHLVASEVPGLTHESNWATLTFGVGEGHAHTHTTGVEAESGNDPAASGDNGIQDTTPAYWYGLGGVLILAVLYFIFRRKKG